MNNISSLVTSYTSQLQVVDVPTARLDTLLLISDVLEKDKSWVLGHPEFELSKKQITKLDAQVKRRARHEPLAYIRGKSEFYGREFLVTSDTLQPRPETETMVELLLPLCPQKIVDVGTGSGCIAITLKRELPTADVYATDISAACLKIAALNAQNLHAKVAFKKTDLVATLDANVLTEAALCCNLPYVPDNFTINQAAMFEPKTAIFGGEDGLDYYRSLFAQLDNKSAHPAVILTESLPTQHPSLEKLAANHNYKLEKAEDFIQLFRRA